MVVDMEHSTGEGLDTPGTLGRMRNRRKGGNAPIAKN